MMKLILISIFLLTGLSNENLIKQIRDEYNLINKSLDSFQKIVNNDIDVYKDLNPDNYSFESGEIYRLAIINLIRFYDSTGLRKAVVTFDGDRQELVSEYYYKNNSLFLVSKKLINSNSLKWSDNFDKDKKEIVENRFYFCGNKLIKWIDKDGKSKKLSSINQDKVRQIFSDSKLYTQIEK